MYSKNLSEVFYLWPVVWKWCRGPGTAPIAWPGGWGRPMGCPRRLWPWSKPTWARGGGLGPTTSRCWTPGTPGGWTPLKSTGIIMSLGLRHGHGQRVASQASRNVLHFSFFSFFPKEPSKMKDGNSWTAAVLFVWHQAGDTSAEGTRWPLFVFLDGLCKKLKSK